MRSSTIIILLFMTVGIVILCILGNWQVQRLHWKEALIERVNARLELEPVPLVDILQNAISRDEHEYTPVTVSGEFDYSKEVYFFTTDKKGASGWNIHSPLKLEDGRILIVNRGFVYFSEKENASRLATPSEKVAINGLVRVPFKEKSGSFPDNSLESREFYWRDLPSMYAVMGIATDQHLPIILDMNEPSLTQNASKEGWPKGGTTIISFTNNHLQYAVTWFGLALTLLGVGGYFLYSRTRATDD